MFVRRTKIDKSWMRQEHEMSRIVGNLKTVHFIDVSRCKSSGSETVFLGCGKKHGMSRIIENLKTVHFIEVSRGKSSGSESIFLGCGKKHEMSRIVGNLKTVHFIEDSWCKFSGSEAFYIFVGKTQNYENRQNVKFVVCYRLQNDWRRAGHDAPEAFRVLSDFQ